MDQKSELFRKLVVLVLKHKVDGEFDKVEHIEFLDNLSDFIKKNGVNKLGRTLLVSATSYGLYFDFPIKNSGVSLLTKMRFWQPQDIIWFMFARGGICRFLVAPLMWFLALNLIYTCHRMKVHKNGDLDTNGKIMAFLRLESGKRHSWCIYAADNYINRYLECDIWSAITKYYSLNLNWYKMSKPSMPWNYIFRTYFNNDEEIKILTKGL